MVKLTDFQITFSGLKLGNHKFDFQIEDAFFQLFDYAELNSGQISAIILLQKKSNMLDLDFQIKGNVTLACDTCSENYKQSIEGNYKQIVKFSDVLEPEETDEIIILPTNEHTLKLAHQLYEFIHLSLPTRRTHADRGRLQSRNIRKIRRIGLSRARKSRPTLVSTSKLEKIKLGTMAHPKRKISKTRRDKRRTHYKAENQQLTTCPTTGETHQTHKAHWVDGVLYHKGKIVMEK